MRALMLIPLALATAACAGGGLQTLGAGNDAYQATGTEPFWSLSIDPRVMIFRETDDKRVTEQTPARTVGVAGERYAGARVRVNIVHARCSDGMSDRSYPDTVEVTVDGRALKGCGGTPTEPGELTNSNWRVETISGKALPAGPSNYVRFGADRVSARFGCNTLTGPYAVTGVTLSVGALASTRMACADPTAEQTAAQVFAQPSTIAFQYPDKLTIGSRAGILVLRRTD